MGKMDDHQPGLLRKRGVLQTFGKMTACGAIALTMAAGVPERWNKLAALEADWKDGDKYVVVARGTDPELQPGEKADLHKNLDVLPQSPDVPAGTPFEERIGQVGDPRILDIMRQIDTTLGGGIRWPDVEITPRLVNAGQYRPGTSRIHLDQDLVYQEFGSGQAEYKSVRQVLVHELQHAISHQRESELHTSAIASGKPYSDASAYSEGRADMAKLLYAELDQRAGADGSKLNQLSAEHRREAVREILNEILTPFDRSEPWAAEIADERLWESVREDKYYSDQPNANAPWRDVSDERTTAYLQGRTSYDEVKVFIPSHHSDGSKRRQELATPLDELATRWTEERNRMERQRRVDDRDQAAAERRAEGRAGPRTSMAAPARPGTAKVPDERPARPATAGPRPPDRPPKPTIALPANGRSASNRPPPGRYADRPPPRPPAARSVAETMVVRLWERGVALLAKVEAMHPAGRTAGMAPIAEANHHRAARREAARAKPKDGIPGEARRTAPVGMRLPPPRPVIAGTGTAPAKPSRTAYTPPVPR